MTTPTPKSATEQLIGENLASDLVQQGIDWLRATAAGWGLNPTWSEVVAGGISVAVVIAVCIAANLVGKLFIRVVIDAALRRTQSAWTKAMVEQKVFRRLSQLVPVAILAFALPAFAQYGVDWWLRPLLEIYTIFVVLLVSFGLLEVGEAIVKQRGLENKIPATGLSQAGKVLLSFVAGVLVLSVLLSQSPLWFLSGLGAVMAVLMLIFKDSILGLVAGIQVSANDMVRVGDWITIPNRGVDGDVEEITLTTIRIRAFDATVSLVPAYDLITNPFTNWRAMSESGGRRIKRSINIDIETIRYVDREDLERYRKFTVLAGYLDRTIAEIDSWNADHGVDTSRHINGRQQTNVGVFRAYIEAYLRQHPKVHQDGFTFLIRHLDPTPQGLPIQVYVFTNDNRWIQYERIQADIFDHLLAAAPEFDLAVFQSPSGRDVQMLKSDR
ncbi:MAG: mechanosensitive ion channel [Phycisphaerales bacterium]|jgi:miniconductance mechanosensitive channel|nr:mechanosensitive ion channel [Phycisphaerales bacterium]